MSRDCLRFAFLCLLTTSWFWFELELKGTVLVIPCVKTLKTFVLQSMDLYRYDQKSCVFQYVYQYPHAFSSSFPVQSKGYVYACNFSGLKIICCSAVLYYAVKYVRYAGLHFSVASDNKFLLTTPMFPSRQFITFKFMFIDWT